MGFSLPASVGVFLQTRKPTVVVVGDGSIMMNLQELQTIKHLGLPIKIIVLNNNAYAVIRKRQTELFRGRTIGTDESNGLSCPDYEAIARAFQLNYKRLETTDETAVSLGMLLEDEVGGLIEIMCREDQDYVRMSRALNSKRRLVVRPLEDQHPYLERDFLRRNMIIAPWNLD
jgi:acetolactate synthase-1/2/3 large subunit